MRYRNLTPHCSGYNLARRISIFLAAVFCNSVNFRASPMFPCILTFPVKNAFCGLISPVISSTTSSSFTMNVTSGFTGNINKHNILSNQNKWLVNTLHFELNSIDPLPTLALITQNPSSPFAFLTLNP